MAGRPGSEIACMAVADVLLEVGVRYQSSMLYPKQSRVLLLCLSLFCLLLLVISTISALRLEKGNRIPTALLRSRRHCYCGPSHT